MCGRQGGGGRAAGAQVPKQLLHPLLACAALFLSLTSVSERSTSEQPAGLVRAGKSELLRGEAERGERQLQLQLLPPGGCRKGQARRAAFNCSRKHTATVLCRAWTREQGRRSERARPTTRRPAHLLLSEPAPSTTDADFSSRTCF